MPEDHTVGCGEVEVEVDVTGAGVVAMLPT